MDINLSTALVRVKMAMVDASLKAKKRHLAVYSSEIRCRTGCDGCCSRMIHVTVAEATVIQEELVKSGRWPEVKQRALEQAPIVKAANPVSWFKMNLKCPALDPETRKCTAYAVRPTPCSTHFAASDPALCDPWSTKGGVYEPVEMPDIHEDFVKKAESELDAHGVLAYRMAMPVALLFAERIKDHKGLSLVELMSLVYNELR